MLGFGSEELPAHQEHSMRARQHQHGWQGGPASGGRGLFLQTWNALKDSVWSGKQTCQPALNRWGTQGQASDQVQVPSLTSYLEHRALQVPRWLLERQKALESAQIYTDLQNLTSSKISYSCCESLIHRSTKSQKLLAHGLADAQEPERNKDQPSEAHLPHCASPGEWVGDP